MLNPFTGNSVPAILATIAVAGGLCLSSIPCYAWAPTDATVWAWMDGPDTVGEVGDYGVKGVPDASNTPGARSDSISWRDGSGNLWLFGGWGPDSAGNRGMLNDLWRYDGTFWTWMSGSDISGEAGVYGIKGIPAPENIPGGRYDSVSWVDESDNLWLFGGYGRDGSGNLGALNDLWKYDGSGWTWVGGSDSFDQPGIYGIKGTPDPGNVPGARSAGLSWTDSTGKFWLFGGNGFDGSGNDGMLNDLWKYDGSDWAWVSGSDTADQPGVYGVKGTPSPDNMPGGRFNSVASADSSDNLWLFGGCALTGAGDYYFNDLWQYDGENWTWVSGSDSFNQAGVYGVKGIPDPCSIPGARYGSVSWRDNNDSLWLFGGMGYDINGDGVFLNDFWVYDGSDWTWVGGSNTVNQTGTYGIPGIPSPDNIPGARYESISWIDQYNTLWLFGGYGYGSEDVFYVLNDLWNVWLGDFDWGDAPDPLYPTLASSNGASHLIDENGPWLGDSGDFPDDESNGQPEPAALGDDDNGDDDENGVVFPAEQRGGEYHITFEVSGGSGTVQAWCDWNGDGSWQHPEEQLFSTVRPDGIYTLVGPVPATAVDETFARFRTSSAGGLTTTGYAPDGEVEDYAVSFHDCPDWDINCDHIADLWDLLKVDGRWADTGPPGWCREDIDNDGIVDLWDLQEIDEHWAETW